METNKNHETRLDHDHHQSKITNATLEATARDGNALRVCLILRFKRDQYRITKNLNDYET
jgi:hypothetical protein